MPQNFSEVGINFSVFGDVGSGLTGLTNLTNTTPANFIANIPVHANEVTGGWYGIIILIAMGIFLVAMLTDITQYGIFRYSSVRGLTIALGIMSTFGIMMMSVGFMTNYIHLTSIVTLYLLLLIYIIISNPS